MDLKWDTLHFRQKYQADLDYANSQVGLARDLIKAKLSSHNGVYSVFLWGRKLRGYILGKRVEILEEELGTQIEGDLVRQALSELVYEWKQSDVRDRVEPRMQDIVCSVGADGVGQPHYFERVVVAGWDWFYDKCTRCSWTGNWEVV